MKYQTSFKKNRGFFSLLIVGFWCLILTAALLVFHGSACAAQVTLAWDASDGAAGYKIYYGAASNNYTSVVDVGTNLTHTFTNLTDGSTYYFAATAYDASHLESDYSAEVSYNSSSNSSLYAAFTGSGTYKYDGTSWNQTTVYSPANMVASGSTLYGNFSNGIWQYNGTSWTQVTMYSPANMVVSGLTLYGNFWNGIWKYDGTSWHQITEANASSITASGTTLYGSFAGTGIWKYDGTSWSQVTTYNPANMVVSGSTLYGSFSNGIWKYDGTSWSQLASYNPTAMVASGSLLYGKYDNGIWKYNGTSWSQITGANAINMAAAQ